MAKIVVDGSEIEVPGPLYHPAGLRGGGGGDSALLLPRAPVDRGQLPHVPGRGRGRSAQARRLLRHGREGSAPGQGRLAAAGAHEEPDGEEGARGGDGVPAHQPPARLPHLRPGRRVRPAGPGDGLRRRLVPLPREQAGGRGQVYRPARQDDHEPLHPLHPLRALHDGSGRDLASSASSGAARTPRSPPISNRPCRPSCRATSSICARSAR